MQDKMSMSYPFPLTCRNLDEISHRRIEYDASSLMKRCFISQLTEEETPNQTLQFFRDRETWNQHLPVMAIPPGHCPPVIDLQALRKEESKAAIEDMTRRKEDPPVRLRLPVRLMIDVQLQTTGGMNV